jgi:excisionase family DNA binding protein
MSRAAPRRISAATFGEEPRSGLQKRTLRKFYTIEEVVESLDVSPRTVSRWIASGELIAHRFGRSVRIADDDLRAFLAQRRGT